MATEMGFPVVYWRPFEGERHALPPAVVPYPGLECETLCGIRTTLVPKDRDWLDPTCERCRDQAGLRLAERRKERAADEAVVPAPGTPTRH